MSTAARKPKVGHVSILPIGQAIHLAAPQADETQWAARRVRLAVEAIRRRWGQHSQRRIAALLRTIADSVEGADR